MPSTRHRTPPAAPSLPFTACVLSAHGPTRARLVAEVEQLQQHAVRVSTLTSVLLDDPILDEQPPDLLIVDVGTTGPAVDDAALMIGHARRRWQSVGLLCINVPTNADVVALLGNGADGALARELPWDVVRAHVAAVARRVQLANAQLRVAFEDLVYDREAHRVWCAGHEVQLTARELRLFDILFLRAGAPVSADTLHNYVWHDDAARGSNSLAVYVGYLRRKLTGSRAAVLETLRGTGYRLTRRRE